MKNKLDVNLINIKKAEKKNTHLIFNLIKNLIYTYEDVNNINYDKVLDWVKKDIVDNINYFYQVYFQNELAGFYCFKKSSLGYELDSLFIFDKFQNLGIGTHVINKCLNSVNCDVFLFVFIKNYRALNLYTRLGFEIVETISKTRYLMIRKY